MKTTPTPITASTKTADHLRKILAHFKRGRKLTSAQAQKWGIINLSARIYDLKKLGYKIEQKDVTVAGRTGRHCAYWMEGE